MFEKEQSQFNGERTVFSTNDDGTIDIICKKIILTPILQHIKKLTQNES